MKIVVSGLGIIGASICASLKRAGYSVYGKNRSKEVVKCAVERGYIDGEATDYEGADVVFLALPPAVTLRELNEGRFPDGCIVADICGVKECLEKAVYQKERNYRYVGTHPMAGKETRGINSASETLFDGANFILTTCSQSDEKAVNLIETLAKDMGFGRILRCTAQKHDGMIALTSQLAHIVSSAYIRSERSEDSHGFTGGSFQDMTRVAGVDEVLWTELYFANREHLLEEADGLISRLTEYRDALEERDGERMKELLKRGRLAREAFLKKD